MITLICGIPGHGKTLFAVSRVAAEAEADGRQVFYHGIPDCRVPGWKQLDEPRDWHKVPARSVVVIDEAHQVFPQRGPSALIPEYVGMAAVLRRLGLDLVLITQDGNSIDHFIRRRCGRYLHVWRALGLERATVWEFGKFCDWEDGVARTGAVRHQFNYPRAAYSLYKSAEVHTVKRRIPLKAFAFPLLFVLLAACAIWGYRALFGESEKNASAQIAKVKGAVTGAVVPSISKSDGQMSTQEYLARRIARVPDLPESAPWFDKLTVPVVFPQVAGCLSSRTSCACYTQQGTRIAGISPARCAQFVQHGEFNPFTAESRGMGRESHRGSEVGQAAPTVGGAFVGVLGDTTPLAKQAAPEQAPARPRVPVGSAWSVNRGSN